MSINCLSSIQSIVPYCNSKPVYTAPPTANVDLSFANTLTNAGSNGGSATLNNTTYWSLDSTYLQVTATTGNVTNPCFFSGVTLGTNGISISFWVSIPSTTVGNNYYPMMVYFNGSGTPGDRYLVGFAPSGTSLSTIQFAFGSNGSSENIIAIPLSTLESTYNFTFSSSFNHIAWAITSSGTWSIYINGIAYSGSTLTTTNMSTMDAYDSSFIFGMEGSSGNFPRLNFNINRFKFYNSPLSSSQMLYLYQNSE